MASRTDLTYQQIVSTGLNPTYTAIAETVDEVQTLTIGGTPTGGTFKLEFGGEVTADITWVGNDDAALIAAIDAALEALSTIGTDNVACADGTLTNGVGTITITFGGDLAADDVALITVNENALTGTAPTLAVEETTKGVSGNHSFANDGRMFVHVDNGAGDPVTVTVESSITVDGGLLAVGDLTVTVPAGEDRMIGPFPSGIYNQSDGKVYVNYSLHDTNIDVAVLRL